MPQYNDYPLAECLRTAGQLVRDGHTVYQKFTCSFCGSRQTIDDPNQFYSQGRCEICDHVTDIAESGCNYMLVADFRPRD